MLISLGIKKQVPYILFVCLFEFTEAWLIQVKS